MNVPPPHYLQALRAYLQHAEPELWAWFTSHQRKEDYTEKLQVELLKSTYRLDQASYGELYKSAEVVKRALELEIPLTLYQGRSAMESNAALFFVPGEGHVVFSGPLLETLTADELRAVIAHELGHYVLWTREQGEFQVSDRLLEAAAADPRAQASHIQTARRARLYTEIYADRCALAVLGELEPVLTGLIKIETGLKSVSGDAYLKQAEEIFSRGVSSAQGVTHPESYIRARALALWQERGQEAEASVSSMIEGESSLSTLDLLQQEKLSKLTLKLIAHLLRPTWLRSPATLAHSKLFSPELAPQQQDVQALLQEFPLEHPSLKEYAAYLLLDCAVVDRELREPALAAMYLESLAWGIAPEFEKALSKELKLKTKELRRLKDGARALVEKVERAHA